MVRVLLAGPSRGGGGNQGSYQGARGLEGPRRK